MQIISLSSRDVINSETVTVDATAGGVALTKTKYRVAGAATGALQGQPHHAREAFITVEDQQIRWNIDPDVTVTATTNGHEADDGDSFSIHGRAIANFRAIRTGGISGAIRVTYFG